MTTSTPSRPRWGVSSPGVLALIEDFLQDAATRTHERLGDVAGVAITTAVTGGEPLTAGTSTRLAADVDHVQYSIGVGPCLDALQEGREHYVPDLARDPRWTPYGVEAARLGVRCSLSVPVVGARSGVLGVVKVYAADIDGLDDRQRHLAREFAHEVAGGVGLANTLVSTSLELDDRIDAMDTRRTIDLATGLLMGRLGCSSEEAFGLLRRESQNNNTKVHDVAADLVSRSSALAAGSATVDLQDDGAGAQQAPFSRRGETPARGH